jgi:hypothetical protein
MGAVLDNAFISYRRRFVPPPQYRLPSYLFRMMKIRALPFKLMPSDHRCLVQEDMQTRKVQTCPNLKAGRV